MPRELAIAGVYVPTLLAVLVVVGGVYWTLDGLLARWGCYERVWHADLFRLSLLISLFSGAGLLIY
jgi:protein AaeX